mmetsp:Transcript_96476/g.245206  ORF Transcript_96476/g.245206 Transcript_96476/m.245206 type:complete len:222 (-) Transcript_96476:53-718(-)
MISSGAAHAMSSTSWGASAAKMRCISAAASILGLAPEGCGGETAGCCRVACTPVSFAGTAATLGGVAGGVAFRWPRIRTTRTARAMTFWFILRFRHAGGIDCAFFCSKSASTCISFAGFAFKLVAFSCLRNSSFPHDEELEGVACSWSGLDDANIEESKRQRFGADDSALSFCAPASSLNSAPPTADRFQAAKVCKRLNFDRHSGEVLDETIGSESADEPG